MAKEAATKTTKKATVEQWVVMSLIGFILTVWLLGELAPTPEHTPVPLSSVPTWVCGDYGPPIAAVRTLKLPEFSNYDVTCKGLPDATPTPATW